MYCISIFYRFVPFGVVGVLEPVPADLGEAGSPWMSQSSHLYFLHFPSSRPEKTSLQWQEICSAPLFLHESKLKCVSALPSHDWNLISFPVGSEGHCLFFNKRTGRTLLSCPTVRQQHWNLDACLCQTDFCQDEFVLLVLTAGKPTKTCNCCRIQQDKTDRQRPTNIQESNKFSP